MSFARPELAMLAFLLPLAAAAAVWAFARRRRKAVAAFGDQALVARLAGADLRRFPRRRLVLLVCAAAALGLALAGPQWGSEVIEGRTRALQVVFALDVSRSMLVSDLQPNRLEVQRLTARRLLRELSGDRVGLVVFAGRAYVLSPLTVDQSALQLYLDALDPEVVSQGGSSLAAALAQAADLARGESDLGGDRAVVLMSDGEALEERDAVLAAADRASRTGVVVFTVGVGSAEGGPVPLSASPRGENSRYTRDPTTGEIVISRLDEDLLRELAARTGGEYVRLGEPGATGRLLSALRGLERGRMTGSRSVRRQEQFGWFVAAAILLLLTDALVERAPSRQRRKAAELMPLGEQAS